MNNTLLRNICMLCMWYILLQQHIGPTECGWCNLVFLPCREAFIFSSCLTIMLAVGWHSCLLLFFSLSVLDGSMVRKTFTLIKFATVGSLYKFMYSQVFRSPPEGPWVSWKERRKKQKSNHSLGYPHHVTCDWSQVAFKGSQARGREPLI